MPRKVAEYEPTGIDFTWIMQVTFVVTILVGAPLIALLSIGVELPTWRDRLEFSIRVGAAVWFVTAIGTYLVARRRQ